MARETHTLWKLSTRIDLPAHFRLSISSQHYLHVLNSWTKTHTQPKKQNTIYHGRNVLYSEAENCIKRSMSFIRDFYFYYVFILFEVPQNHSSTLWTVCIQNSKSCGRCYTINMSSVCTLLCMTQLYNLLWERKRVSVFR